MAAQTINRVSNKKSKSIVWKHYGFVRYQDETIKKNKVAWLVWYHETNISIYHNKFVSIYQLVKYNIIPTIIHTYIYIYIYIHTTYINK